MNWSSLLWLFTLFYSPGYKRFTQIPLNIQDKVPNTTCLYLFACWHINMYFFLVWLICWGSN